VIAIIIIRYYYYYFFFFLQVFTTLLLFFLELTLPDTSSSATICSIDSWHTQGDPTAWLAYLANSYPSPEGSECGKKANLWRLHSVWIILSGWVPSLFLCKCPMIPSSFVFDLPILFACLLLFIPLHPHCISFTEVGCFCRYHHRTTLPFFSPYWLLDCARWIYEVNRCVSFLLFPVFSLSKRSQCDFLY
jgi:hypothetical protein